MYVKFKIQISYQKWYASWWPELFLLMFHLKWRLTIMTRLISWNLAEPNTNEHMKELTDIVQQYSSAITTSSICPAVTRHAGIRSHSTCGYSYGTCWWSVWWRVKEFVSVSGAFWQIYQFVHSLWWELEIMIRCLNHGNCSLLKP